MRTWSWFGGAGLPWEKYGGGFETLVSGTAPVFWAFFLLTGLSLFVLRLARWQAGRVRSRRRCYPVPPIIFCATCVYMLYSSLTYARGLAIIGLLPLAAGIPLYAISQWWGRGAVTVERLQAERGTERH